MNSLVNAWWTVLCASVFILSVLWLAVRLVFSFSRDPQIRYRWALGALVSWTGSALAIVGLEIVAAKSATAPAAFEAFEGTHRASAWSVSDPAFVQGALRCWLAGTLLVLIWQAVLLGRLAAIRRQAMQAPPWLLEVAEQEARRVGLPRRPSVMVTDRVDTPCLIGTWRPTIVWPAAHLGRASSSRLAALMLHEMVHLRRGDVAANALQVVLEGMFFYHPALWSLCAIARHERETSCDALVLRYGTSHAVYAEALLELESLRVSTTQPLAIAARSRENPMLDRLYRIRLIPRIDSKSLPKCRSATLQKPMPMLALVGLAMPLVIGMAWQGASAAQGCTEASACAASQQIDDPRLAPHWADLQAAAVRYGLDPVLLGAMCIAESNGRTDALSPYGAVGLMQVMPQTFEGIAQERGVTAPSRAEQFEVAINVDYAAYLLKRDLERYSASYEPQDAVRWALAAYSAGPRRVAAAQRGEKPLPDATLRYTEQVLVERQRLLANRSER